MKVEDISESTLKEVSNQEILSLHLRMHQLYSLAKKFNNQKVKKLLYYKHSILVNEMKIRHINHESRL